jgi:hypothetical protein
MLRFMILFCMGVLVSPVWAATAPPNADTPPLLVTTPNTPSQIMNCPDRPPVAHGAPSNIVVELDPNTLWRPRLAEVRFTIRGPSANVMVKQVRVCFGWSSPDGVDRRAQELVGSPQVRSIGTDNGATAYGALVPRLQPVPWADWWPRRLFTAIPYVFSGAGVVPVADMVVEVTLADGADNVVVTAIQVGVTSSAVSWIVVLVVALLVMIALYRIAEGRKPQGWSLPLWIISSADGQASLSQLQIVLWTAVVGMSAIYVMTLSGNLISISTGTLTLLGIAGGTALVARLPGFGQPSGTTTAATGAPTVPLWSDVTIPDRQSNAVDVTRLQMLSFTLIAASFVLIKVVVDYEIPEIPSNFLILMGVSNGVYVAGRKWPGTENTTAQSGQADAPPAVSPPGGA